MELKKDDIATDHRAWSGYAYKERKFHRNRGGARPII